MKQFLYFSLLLVFIQPLQGLTQNKNTIHNDFTQIIKGIVIDKSTKLILQGVTVKVSSIDPVKTAATDVNGIYKILNVPVGRHTLEISHTGYQQVTLTEVLVTTGKETEVNIELGPQSKQLSGISIGVGRDKQPV